MVQEEMILRELEALLKLDDVLACMLAKKGLEGIAPSKMRVQNVDLWRLLKEATNELFDLIDRFYDYKMDRLYFELGEYTVIIAPISRSFGLLVIIPSLANMGLLDVEIENTKRKINEVL